MIRIICAYCNVEVYREKLSNSKSGLYFCGRLCKENAQSIEGGFKEIQPPHYKTGSYYYRQKAFKRLPHKCNRCGYSVNRRALQVHHKDRNRNNNLLNNLEIICANCHALEHWGHGAA